MPLEFLIARRYLAPHRSSAWEWRDGGQVVAWRDGGTIAFRAEIESVLDRLATGGLPPMDAVVMFLAACRANQRPDGRELLSATDLLPQSWVAGQEDQLSTDVVSTLNSIAALPSSLRDTPAHKADLAAVVFEAARPAESPATAAAIVRELRRGFGAEMLFERRDEYAPDLLYRLAPLAAGVGRIEAVRLVLRQSTGMEQLPEPAAPDEPEADSFAALLKSLERDEELGGMIRLTRQLMAALTLPRAVSEPQDLPLGGVSDITNRGPLDRLLVSELAHDDLTFTVRVALNEALYLRREAPPHVPPRRRMVLIDSGLRMWGIPRVFATAAALALAGTRRNEDEFAVFRPRQSNLDHVDLHSRAGLVAHLAALEPSAHPGAAIPTFRRLAMEDESVGEAILITGEDVLTDKSFRHALAQAAWPMYVVSVHRSGRMRLTRRSPQGTKLLREARYELDQILAPTPRITPLIDPNIDASLPAILRLNRFPLLLPHAVDPQRVWGEPGRHVLCLTHDRRLMHWSDHRFGGRQLSDAMPPGKLHWHEHRQGEPNSYAVVGRLSQGGLSLVQVDLAEKNCRIFPLALQQHNPKSVAAHAGALFVIFPDHVEVFSQSAGEPIQSLKLPSQVTWHRDRFFMDAHGWHALSFNGTSAVLEKVCEQDRRPPVDQLIALFDSEHCDGPVGVTGSGEFRYFYNSTPATGPVVPGSDSGPFARRILPRTRNFYQFGAISSDGRRLVLCAGNVDSRGKRESWLMNLHSGEVTRTEGDPQSLLTAPLLAGLTQRTLRNRFKAIYLDGETLTLVPARGDQHLGIVHSSGFPAGAEVRFTTRFPPAGFRELRLETVASPRGAGYRLAKAEWQDGSRAYLDSRGLLHLKSSDPSIPEVTLVLGERAFSGWCADGRVWGDEYFTGDVARTDPRQIYEEILRRFLMRLR